MYDTLNSRGVISIIIILFIIVLSSCASPHHSGRTDGQRGEYVTASWYGKAHDGKLTASGERFDMYAMTCAHRSLPFGTRLRVTNPGNNQSVIVTVNDRGPFVRGRGLDLSYAAAKRIGIIEQGVQKVMVERVR